MKICPHCGSTFEDGGRFCPVDGTALRLTSTTEIVPGTVIGDQYEILKELGRGGMGVVYLARDIKLDRLSALKVLRSDALNDAEAVARFHREATNASRFGHPNVVGVYNFGETDDRVTYLAMEYVEGESLAARLDEVGALSPRAAARIVWQVANALGAAHDVKIVHRDLKPGNIMLTRYRDWDDFVKVVDFGIAKAFGTISGTGITSKGKWVGTPAYMSPEQWTSGDVDHRSDLYSLGLIAVSMLAGGLPLDLGGPLPTGRKLLEALPPNDWPEPLNEVLACCLAPKPDDRFQSAADFAAAFIGAVCEWIPPQPGVREPWDARVSPSTLPTPVVAASDGQIGDPASTSPPGARRRRLWPYMVGAVPFLVAGIWYLGNPWGPASAPTQLVPPDSTENTPGELPDDSAGTPPQPEPRETASVEIDSSASPTAASSEPPTIRAALDRLQTLTDPDDPDPDSARAALNLATTLLQGSLPDSTRVEVTYHLAEANLMLNNSAAACRQLREILPMAETNGVFARAIQALLQVQCG